MFSGSVWKCVSAKKDVTLSCITFSFFFNICHSQTSEQNWQNLLFLSIHWQNIWPKKFEYARTIYLHLMKYCSALNFGNPPSEKNISLKHLKLPKNHFKANLFFVQLKHLKSSFTFGKKMKINAPPSYQKVQISNFGLFDFLCWPLHFLWHFLFWRLP